MATRSLTAADALQEALCSGWIDGQHRSHDETTFLQRYTPRCKASIWSEKNTQFVTALIEQGRMRPRWQEEIDKAKADGRWDRAYQGQATAQVPEDLQRALNARPTAKVAFEALKSQPRYYILYQQMIAKIEKTKANRIVKSVTELNRPTDELSRKIALRSNLPVSDTRVGVERVVPELGQRQDPKASLGCQ